MSFTEVTIGEEPDKLYLSSEALIGSNLDAKRLGEEIERVLWSYNYQYLHAKNGCLVPSSSRFTYKIDITYKSEDQLIFSNPCHTN